MSQLAVQTYFPFYLQFVCLNGQSCKSNVKMDWHSHKAAFSTASGQLSCPIWTFTWLMSHWSWLRRALCNHWFKRSWLLKSLFQLMPGLRNKYGWLHTTVFRNADQWKKIPIWILVMTIPGTNSGSIICLCDKASGLLESCCSGMLRYRGWRPSPCRAVCASESLQQTWKRRNSSTDSMCPNIEQTLQGHSWHSCSYTVYTWPHWAMCIASKCRVSKKISRFLTKTILKLGQEARERWKKARHAERLFAKLPTLPIS